MSTNIDAIRARLNKLQGTQKTADSLWKPSVGKHQLRLVPYKFNKEIPFIELYFHYNINNKSSSMFIVQLEWNNLHYIRNLYIHYNELKRM